ncbi:MAG: transketolase [Desulfobacterales bacterium]|nr:transketolase [Desulfobacterales bacterium]MDJ0873999.1 transketolase [Desulfobacterales bacterium]
MSEGQTDNRSDLDLMCVNTIRTLAMDAVEQAKSGHPGAPMGMAAAAYVLWTSYLRHNPVNPHWPDRDRFVLSGGHASMLLYSLLHLTGYELSLEDIKNFRQWGSKTPGHPEYGHTPGVETTTGPLGQGFANAVGMAMAERHLAARFNAEGNAIVDHYTYVMCGDGDLMEGISAEAASLAGHLGLGKLIVLYDDNQISIEGPTDITFTEDVRQRFEAIRWHVQKVEDGNDIPAIAAAIEAAREEADRPSIIMLRTQIAFGSPNKQGTADAHGAPLGEAEVCLTKQCLGCPDDAFFCVHADVETRFRECLTRGQTLETAWNERLEAYRRVDPEKASQWDAFIDGKLPAGWKTSLPAFSPQDGPIATRAASGTVLNAVAARVTNLVGGSADLAPSNKTFIDGSPEFQKSSYDGRNIRFGVREHAMTAIMSGMRLHGGLRPYGGTFLVFADYMRPAIRLAALMGLPVIYVLTHDSIAVGEDGPTHQPVEHLASLRAIPGLTVIRPADASETAEAWQQALESRDQPVALVLTRQKLPVLDRQDLPPDEGLARGAYILADSNGQPDIILIASGSEVHLAMEAAAVLHKQGVAARVVSMPSWELFEAAPADYREKVLPAATTVRLAVEAALPMGWERYVLGPDRMVGVNTFGASAPGPVVQAKYGLTVDNVVERAVTLLNS